MCICGDDVRGSLEDADRISVKLSFESVGLSTFISLCRTETITMGQNSSCSNPQQISTNPESEIELRSTDSQFSVLIHPYFLFYNVVFEIPFGIKFLMLRCFAKWAHLVSVVQLMSSSHKVAQKRSFCDLNTKCIQL